MREKLNESKAAQIGLVAVLVVVVAFMLLKGSGGGEEGEAEVPAGASETAVTTEVAGAVEATGATGMGELPTSVPAAPGPPRRFTAAYDSGDTVALLVVHDGGIDDAYTTRALKEVAQIEHVTAFVVPAKKISRYASVTVGLDVNQLPALIVLRPKALSNGVPQATVAYGYQTPESIYVSVLDATYKGPEVTYHPG
jgi:hypothetical protein